MKSRRPPCPSAVAPSTTAPLHGIPVPPGHLDCSANDMRSSQGQRSELSADKGLSIPLSGEHPCSACACACWAPGAGGICVTETQTPTQCSHGGQMPIPRKTAGEIPGFPDSAYRVGPSSGAGARLPASCCESQIIFSRPYFRVSNFVNNLRDQSTDSLSRPSCEAEGHRGGRQRCTSGL